MNASTQITKQIPLLINHYTPEVAEIVLKACKTNPVLERFINRLPDIIKISKHTSNNLISLRKDIMKKKRIKFEYELDNYWKREDIDNLESLLAIIGITEENEYQKPLLMSVKESIIYTNKKNIYAISNYEKIGKLTTGTFLPTAIFGELPYALLAASWVYMAGGSKMHPKIYKNPFLRMSEILIEKVDKMQKIYNDVGYRLETEKKLNQILRA